ncbi:MAG TPA: GAF domain-containing protein [Ignavibacteriaceae bacterium]|nr:MAG: Response regulator PleD [Ignavibacteria bacterium ADurb.Bin266]HQI40426.1 GAF domain-containing protein [Ignavibacteriaceae bacterium]
MLIDKRQKKRVLIFLLVPILAALLFLSDDLLLRFIIIAVIIIYVAFIIFLRDSVRLDGKYSINEDEVLDSEYNISGSSDQDGSFKIITKTITDADIITASNYVPEFKAHKTTLIPPDLKERFEEIATELPPAEIGNDGQFVFALEKILTVIKDAYSAHTAIFFWYNKKKEKLSIEKFVSASPNEIAKRKFDIEDDILSKIVQKNEPELLSDISPAAEADVIRYYDKAQKIRSFVGVPLFYEGSLIAILAVDSKVGDAFGIETIYSLGRFVRVITMIIQFFEEKHTDNVSQQRLKGLLNLIGPETNFDTEDDLLASMQNSLSELIEWDALVFVYFKPVEQKFETLRVINKTSLKYIGQGLQIDLTGTLVGKAILSGSPVKIDDTGADNYKRFSKSEDLTFEGSFLAIPLIYGNQNFGVLCFESLKKNIYTNSDVKFLRDSVHIISYIIYSHSSQTLIKSLMALDMETRALNRNTFVERLNADLYKANMLNVPGALVLIKIDEFLEQESLFDGDPFPKVLKVISESIAAEMTPINIFGRIDEKIFAVYFFNTESKKVYVWAERLRVKIARMPIAIVSKQNTYTVSIGVASTHGKTDTEEVFHNAELALQKAVEKGGNAVKSVS